VKISAGAKLYTNASSRSANPPERLNWSSRRYSSICHDPDQAKVAPKKRLYRGPRWLQTDDNHGQASSRLVQIARLEHHALTRIVPDEVLDGLTDVTPLRRPKTAKPMEMETVRGIIRSKWGNSPNEKLDNISSPIFPLRHFELS